VLDKNDNSSFLNCKKILKRMLHKTRTKAKNSAFNVFIFLSLIFKKIISPFLEGSAGQKTKPRRLKSGYDEYSREYKVTNAGKVPNACTQAKEIQRDQRRQKSITSLPS
jgi:hypothetical protein